MLLAKSKMVVVALAAGMSIFVAAATVVSLKMLSVFSKATMVPAHGILIHRQGNCLNRVIRC